MEVIEAIRSRRSIRDYRPDPVPRSLIREIIADAVHAPPPFAGQVPWTFVVLEGVERISALGAKAKAYAREHRPGGEAWAWTEREDFIVFWNAPVVVIIAGPVEDCCRAGQLVLLSAHARGVGACWVGAPMLWLRTREAKAEIGVPDDLSAVSAICLGYAAEVPERRDRPEPKVIWSA